VSPSKRVATVSLTAACLKTFAGACVDEGVRVGRRERRCVLRSALREEDDRCGDAPRDRKRAGSRDDPATSDGRRGGSRTVERGILAQDRLLEVTERLARLDAELFDESLAGLAVDAESFCLTARAIEGEHQLPAHALAEGVARGQRFELGHERVVVAERKLRLDALLDRDQAQLLQPLDLGPRERLVREICKRTPAPEAEGGFERVQCLLVLARRIRLPAFLQQSLEPLDVDAFGGDLEDVSTGTGDERLVRLERFPEP
jgi:hypothetical protein